jgi:TrmH family RNA methyltransferase
VNEPPQRISSSANPTLAMLRRLARDGAAYRRIGRVWLEGEHLCTAALAHRAIVRQTLVAESGWANPALRALAERSGLAAVVSDSLFESVSALESPAGIGLMIDTPAEPELAARAPTVVLDRLQDAGNVGSILRSAAALGARQVIALKGSVALWSPKVLRAAMGAHFSLALLEGRDADVLDSLAVHCVATSSHAGQALHRAVLPSPCAWVFGHEGQGIAAELLVRCALTVRIPQPGGEESINVAAAAAICLYESLRSAQP